MSLSISRTRLGLFSLLWMWALACAPPPTSSPIKPAVPRTTGPTPDSRQHRDSPQAHSQPPHPALGEVESQTLAGINVHRTSIGLRPLRHDSFLAEIARAHSRSMADGQAPLGHDGMSSRTAKVRAYMPSRRVAENVSKSSRALNQVAHAAVTGWLASPVHLRNIDGPYSTTGIGAARSAQGVTFMTQIFAEN